MLKTPRKIVLDPDRAFATGEHGPRMRLQMGSEAYRRRVTAQLLRAASSRHLSSQEIAGAGTGKQIQDEGQEDKGCRGFGDPLPRALGRKPFTRSDVM